MSRMDRECESSISRRIFFIAAGSGIVGMAGTSPPLASAQDADPVFDAIQRHRAAVRAFEDAFDRMEPYEVAVSTARQSGTSLAVSSAEAALAPVEAEMKSRLEAETLVWRDLVKTRATSLAGLTTFIRYLIEQKETLDGDEDSAPEALGTILAALSTITAA